MRALTLPLFLTILGILTLFSSLALAGDVEVQLPAGDSFVVTNRTGEVERLRVDEATGDVVIPGAATNTVAGTPVLVTPSGQLGVAPQAAGGAPSLSMLVFDNLMLDDGETMSSGPISGKDGWETSVSHLPSLVLVGDIRCNGDTPDDSYRPSRSRSCCWSGLRLPFPHRSLCLVA